MLTRILWILLLSSIYQTHAQNDVLINSIVSFIKMQKSSTVVTAVLCFSKEHKMILGQRLHHEGILTSIHNYKKFPAFTPPEHQLFIVDGNCPNAKDLLDQAENSNLYAFPYRWLVLNPPADIPFDNYRIYINSRVYIANIENGQMKVESLYKPWKKRDVRLNDIGTWDSSGNQYYNQLSDSRNRSDLNKETLNVSVVTIFNQTKDHLEDGRYLLRDAITKQNYPLSNFALDMMNATGQLIFVPAWGANIPNSTRYTDQLGALYDEIADIASTPSFVTTARIKDFRYVYPTTRTKAKFILKAPALSVVANILTLPFSTHVWYASFILCAVIFVVVFVIIKWEWTSSRFSDKFHLRPTPLDVIQMQIGAICQQGAEAEPQSLSGRIATFFIFVTLMFIYTSYSAQIVALLQSTTKSISSVEDLLESKISLGASDVSYSRMYMKMTIGDVHKAVYQKKLTDDKVFVSIEDGVRRIKEDFYAFHAECDTIYKTIGETYAESEKCGLIEIEFWSFVYPYTIIKKNSTVLELIKVAYAKMMERGQTEREYNRVYRKKPTCAQGASFRSVSLSDSYFAFILFAAGLKLSLVILCLERAGKKCHNRYVQPKSVPQSFVEEEHVDVY